MKIYLTNYSYQQAKAGKSIYIHSNRDCKKLNSDYDEGEKLIGNSGIKESNFTGKEKLLNKLILLHVFTPCRECDLIENIKAWDSLLIEE